ncbi:MAG: type II toxin-antitoxin system Phd/YefM family antitoxin [Magnetococcales bacterium]|nr:type II toxin-antitoxin system Phd/YefM family antitoxin [Magnetococcales bacterium]
MRMSEKIKPVRYLKNHAPEIMRGLAEGNAPLIITHHGEAKAVLQEIEAYNQTQETLALLKLLAMSNREIENKEMMPAMEVIQHLRKA